MYRSIRVLSTILFTILVFVGGAVPAMAGSNTQNLPDDLVSLLPDNLHALVVSPSLETMDEAVQPFAYLFDLPDGETFDTQLMLSEALGDAALLIDPGKPLALALTVGNVMAGEEPIMTLVLYLDADATECDDRIRFAAGSEDAMAPRMRQGKYVAFSTALAITPGNGSAALLEDIPAGSLVASMDLVKIFGDFRPLIEMGLGMAAMSAGAAPADSSATAPAMSAQEITALTKMLVALMDSGRRYNLVLSTKDDQLVIKSDLYILPDSPLAPGPQPSFNKALELTRILPADASFVMAQAWKFGTLLDMYTEYYLASIEKMTKIMDPEVGSAFLSWYQVVMEKIDMYELPMAGGFNITHDGLNTNCVILCDDTPLRMAEMTAMMEDIPQALGYLFTPLPTVKVGGVQVKSWTMEFDSSVMMGALENSMNETAGQAAEMQLAMTDMILARVMPKIFLAGQGDHLFLCTGNDTNSMEAMLKSAKMRRGGVDKFTAKVAKSGGSDCRQLQIMDLMAVLGWFSELMEEMAHESGELDLAEDIPTPEGPPIMFSSTTSAGSTGYSSMMSMKTSELTHLIDAILELTEYMQSGE